jgi:glycosyltransferase involved in cell wall biosynthesis
MKIVISGVNLTEAGPLKVFKDVVKSFLNCDVEIICLVNSNELFNEIISSKITFIEYPNVKKKWMSRIFFEYIQCRRISEKLRPDIWLSMHDMSPFLVSVPCQFVYCHNASIFYKATLNDFRFDFKFSLFTLFYKWIYRINLRSNLAIIVQQNWIGHYFHKNLKCENILISKPISDLKDNSTSISNKKIKGKIKFFYPALGRTFKNFEVLFNALQYLKDNYIYVYNSIELSLTISKFGSEYEKYLINKFNGLSNVIFLGKLDFSEVEKEYARCDVVIFPSKLETWGLPISEAKEYNKPIILSDLPYAHETLGNYSKAKFFDINDPIALSHIIIDLYNHEDVFLKKEYCDKSSFIVCNSVNELSQKIINISQKKISESN